MTSPQGKSAARGQHSSAGGSNSMLLELIDRILDKGIVIDAWARVSLLSVELLTVEARVVVASVETYLRYAEAIGNTALASMPNPQQAQLPQQATQGALQTAQGATQALQQPASQANVHIAPAQSQPVQQSQAPQYQQYQQYQPQQAQQAQQPQQPQQAQQPQPTQQPQQQNTRQR